MSEPAIAVNQEGLRRRRRGEREVPDEMGRALGPVVLPSPARPGPREHSEHQPLPPSNALAALTSVLGCPWLNLAAGFLWLSRVLGPS